MYAFDSDRSAAGAYPQDEPWDLDADLGADQDSEPPVPHAVLESIARRALTDVMAEEVRRGQPYGEAQRMQLATTRGEALCLEWMREQQAHQQHRELLDELQALRRATADMAREQATQAQHQPVAQLVDFWRRHPILVGWFGADIVHALKRGRRP